LGGRLQNYHKRPRAHGRVRKTGGEATHDRSGKNRKRSTEGEGRSSGGGGGGY